MNSLNHAALKLTTCLSWSLLNWVVALHFRVSAFLNSTEIRLPAKNKLHHIKEQNPTKSDGMLDRIINFDPYDKV